MGLDCSHDAYHGSYGAFNRLRRAICEAAGGNWPPHEDSRLDPERWYLPDDFDRQGNTGLILFLSHSDCDGEFTPSECESVARDLRKVRDKVSEKYGWGHLSRVGGARAAVEKFIAGCDRAAQAGEFLTFR